MNINDLKAVKELDDVFGAIGVRYKQDLDLEAMKQHAKSQKPDEWGQRFVFVQSDKLVAMIEALEAFLKQREGLAEVVQSAQETQQACLKVQQELLEMRPQIEAEFIKKNVAMSYLRTLANFGGAIEQARALAVKAVEELS